LWIFLGTGGITEGGDCRRLLQRNPFSTGNRIRVFGNPGGQKVFVLPEFWKSSFPFLVLQEAAAGCRRRLQQPLRGDHELLPFCY
jgi:hypothetical protein